MSTTTCKIPLGMFYGHMVVLPGEDYSELSDSSSFDHNIFDPSLQVTIDTQCNILSALAEDVQCRYYILYKNGVHPLNTGSFTTCLENIFYSFHVNGI